MSSVTTKILFSKKSFLIVISFVIAGLFISFQKKHGFYKDPGEKYEKILRNVGMVLEQVHVSPKKIDDAFSKEVFNYFIKELDEDKTIFIQSDIDNLKKYEDKIDDEIHGDSKLESFYAITDVYKKRMNEVSKFYDSLLSKPFDYSRNDSIVLDREKLNFAKTENERVEVWQKRLKYLSLVKYMDLLDEKEKNKTKGNYYVVENLPGVSAFMLNGKVSFTVDSSMDKDIHEIKVQRSSDSIKNFTSISSFTKLTKNQKYFIDNIQTVNKVYYRFLALDKDGTYKYGKVILQDKDSAALESDAREQIKKQITRYFTTLKNHNTTDELFSTFVNSITATMDPHTDYFAPVDERSFNEAISGSFYGIGAQLREEDGKITVTSLVTGSPAWKSGEIQSGDEIIKIGEGKKEPVDVSGYALPDAVKLIRGSEKGSEVRLTLRKPDGAVKVVSLFRDQIKLDDTFAKSAIIKGEHKIGYIYLPEFYVDFEREDGAKCSDDVAKEIKNLKEEKVDGIIIDLRGNGGGSLPEVVKMAGLFISDGPICQVKGRDEKPFQWKDKDKSILYDGPLTVMVDENSASASEIFAAAIQDYKRGIIVGSSSTFGKGTVQRSIQLNPDAETDNLLGKKSEDMGSIKLTLQKFYRINGGSTQLKGVVPDIVLPDRFEFAKSRERDMPNALKWDEIPKADYNVWNSDISTDLVASQINKQLESNSVFTGFKKDIEWINVQNDKIYSLQIDQYKADQLKLKNAYKEIDSLTKLRKDLVVINDAADLEKIKSDKEKIEKNKQFINRIKSDVYIDENVKIINQMITDGELAKSNGTK